MSNTLLKICRKVLVPLFLRFFNACLKHCHHPHRFKHATTVVLRKPKGPYWDPKNWRPIALLYSIGRLFEAAIVKMLTEIAVKQNMIPPEQMAFAGRTTSDALLYVETIIRAAWANGRIVTLLSLDMSKAFDRVNRTRPLQILHRKGVPPGLIVLIRSFLPDRTTTIRMPGRSPGCQKPAFANSFMFYTSLLLEELARPASGMSSRHQVAFSDDIAILRVSESVHTNCQGLSQDFRICDSWAKDHDMEFNPKNFDCMHFTRRKLTRTEWYMTPRIPNFTPGDDYQVKLKLLGVILDPQLAWDAHMAHIELKKVASLRRTFKRLFGPKFGPFMEIGTLLYNSVAFAAIRYGHEVWGDQTWLLRKHKNYLETTQNTFLRIIRGVLSGARVVALHKELHMTNILVELERLRNLSLAKTRMKPVWLTIAYARDKVYAQTQLWNLKTTTYRRIRDPFNDRWTHAYNYCSTLY
ncbi:hypothetical protein G6011_04168 [Alternaria panax]|uniref:Reverse transcriptase domain-containing protein n=1 Tax=Alternaria panax TaxID=48097 RepID=A0AAD4IG13_9PLEO|nr:hypothetical protein G6011_04168 [Alternaria panax]